FYILPISTASVSLSPNSTLSLPLTLFFFNATAPTEIYTLSLHDALPISAKHARVEPIGSVTMRRDRECALSCELCCARVSQNITQGNCFHAGHLPRDAFVLVREQRARRVDDARAGCGELDRGPHDLLLARDERRDVALAQPPARLGVAAERADPRARCIDEHDVGLAAHVVELARPALALQLHRLRVADGRAAGAPAQLLELLAVDVAREHA